MFEKSLLDQIEGRQRHIGMGSSGSVSMMPRMSFLEIMTSYGAQLSRIILQLLFLSIETMAGIPEIIGVFGKKNAGNVVMFF